MAVPTRTWVAPNAIASAKSALMPMERRRRPLRPAIAGIDLGEQERCPALLGDLTRQRFAHRGSIDRMNGIEQRHRLLGLVGLQRPDQMQLCPGILRLQGRPLRGRLLHPVLAENMLARRQHRRDRRPPESLCHRDQRHLGRIAPRLGASLRDLLEHGLEPRRCVGPVHD
jgi:hypothetical protein